ncbi:MAG: hypothetical protein AB4080_10730 [Trichodesmium sp.]
MVNLPELSESQADRMGEIIEMAKLDNLLNSLMEKIDYSIYEDNGLFSKDNVDYYQNQKAWIKEFIVC